ncbi:MAG: hypothetical protein C0597_01805 [Marinilabiliales bacterium]|nr:MAG: hypothetical protein C0597_01805 [Marinilabiliales bacterium]
MKDKVSRIFEVLWIIVAILCLSAAIHQTIYEGISKSYVLFIFSLIAFAMYFVRKQIRKSKKDNSNG